MAPTEHECVIAALKRILPKDCPDTDIVRLAQYAEQNGIMSYYNFTRSICPEIFSTVSRLSKWTDFIDPYLFIFELCSPLIIDFDFLDMMIPYIEKDLTEARDIFMNIVVNHYKDYYDKMSNENIQVANIIKTIINKRIQTFKFKFNDLIVYKIIDELISFVVFPISQQLYFELEKMVDDKLLQLTEIDMPTKLLIIGVKNFYNMSYFASDYTTMITNVLGKVDYVDFSSEVVRSLILKKIIAPSEYFLKADLREILTQKSKFDTLSWDDKSYILNKFFFRYFYNDEAFPKEKVAEEAIAFINNTFEENTSTMDEVFSRLSQTIHTRKEIEDRYSKTLSIFKTKISIDEHVEKITALICTLDTEKEQKEHFKNGGNYYNSPAYIREMEEKKKKYENIKLQNEENEKKVNEEREALGIIEYGIFGLGNLGNTCFLNSTLQCLNSVPAFTDNITKASTQTIFANVWKEHHRDLAMRDKSLSDKVITTYKGMDFTQQNNWKEYSSKNNISVPLKSLFEFTCANKAQHIIPKTFKSNMSIVNALFEGSEQHDASEFLGAILNRLHTENKYVNVEPDKDLITITDQSMNIQLDTYKTSLLEYINNPNNFGEQYVSFKASRIGEIIQASYDDFMNKNNSKDGSSFITKNFTGTSVLVVVCAQCRNITFKFENFNILSMDVGGVTEITQCMGTFVREENMTGDDRYACDVCNMKTEALKQTYIYKLPKVVTIQLKRFCYDVEKMAAVKRYNEIAFPTKDLSLKEMLFYENVSIKRESYTDQHTMDANTLYDLVAVSYHTGSCDFGHYTAICKNQKNGKWYEADDTKVTYITDEEFEKIKAKNAYVLYYVKKDDEDYIMETPEQACEINFEADLANIVQVPLPVSHSIVPYAPAASYQLKNETVPKSNTTHNSYCGKLYPDIEPTSFPEDKPFKDDTKDFHNINIWDSTVDDDDVIISAPNSQLLDDSSDQTKELSSCEYNLQYTDNNVNFI